MVHERERGDPEEAREIATRVAYLDLSDYLAIAERVLGIPAETLIRFDRLVALARAMRSRSFPEFDCESSSKLSDRGRVLQSTRL